MNLIAVNDFHNKVIIVEGETYENDFGQFADIQPDILDMAAAKLCGIKDCQCKKVHWIEDNDGNKYSLPY